MQIKQRIFKCTGMQVLHFSRHNSEIFEVSSTFLPLTVV